MAKLKWESTMASAGPISVDLTGFHIQMNGIMRMFPTKAKALLKKGFFDLLKRIIKATPVDKGQARAGWMAAGYAYGMSSSVLNEGANPDPTAQAEGLEESEYEFNDKGKNIFESVTNTVAHIVPLEYGHSGKAPAGMVRVSIAQMKGKLGDLIDVTEL